MSVELVTPCKHGLIKNHDYGPPHDPIECVGGSRSTVSGFSPEAVQAAARSIEREIKAHILPTPPPHGMGSSYLFGVTIEELAEVGLAAAWAHDFGDR